MSGTFWIVAPFAEPLAAVLGELPAGVDVRTAPGFDAIGPEAESIEALSTMGHGLAVARSSMPRLRWLQVLMAETDGLSGIDLHGVVLSTVSGAHVPQIAELAFLFMLGIGRDVRRVIADQADCRWQPCSVPTLAGSHVVIVGTGKLAQGLARRLQAFEVRVTGVSSTPRAIDGFDAVVAHHRLMETAADADHIVLLAALNHETRGPVSRAVLEALPAHATVINLARGDILDEPALVGLLQAGLLHVAGLDVFATEPLPSDSPLWNMPNVLMTPYIGGWSTGLVDQIAPIVRENVVRWFASPRQPLLEQQAAP